MKYKTIGEVVEAAKKEHEAAGKKWTKEIELQVRRAHVQQLVDEGLLKPKTEEKPVGNVRIFKSTEYEDGIPIDYDYEPEGPYDDMISTALIIVGVVALMFIGAILF